jgi:hypothetical protein
VCRQRALLARRADEGRWDRRAAVPRARGISRTLAPPRDGAPSTPGCCPDRATPRDNHGRLRCRNAPRRVRSRAVRGDRRDATTTASRPCRTRATCAARRCG